MKKQRPRIAQMIALTFLISLAICSKEQTETEYEKLFDELKANVEFYESQNNSFGTGQFTALKITTRGITTHETLEMYKSLFKIPKQEGKITVLTIKNTHIPEAFSLEKCIESIATAAQNHIYGKRNETTSDDLCIRIERVDSARIAEHSSWNRVLEEVERTEKAFAIFILENLYNIIHKSFIQFIFDAMFVSIFDHLYEKSFALHEGEKTAPQAKFDVERWYRLNSYDFKNFSVKNMCKIVSRKAIIDEYSPLSFLKSFVHDYEKRNGYKYFTQNDKAIEQSFIDTVEKYRYFVDQEFKLNVPSLKALVEETNHSQFLRDIIKNMFSVMVEHLNENKITLCDKFGVEYYASIFNQTLKFDPTFTEQHQEYYKMISFDPAHLRISDQDRKTDLLKSLRADNVAKIIIRGELDEAVLSRICNTLRSTELMKNFIGHQSMYIDFEREMSKDQLETSLGIFKSRKRSLDDANPVLDTKFKAPEVLTTVKSLHNYNDCNTIQLLTYTTDTVAVNEQQGSQILAKYASIATKTMIKIETWFDSHGSTKFASSKLITTDGNQAGRVDVITINNGCKVVKISITRDAKCDLGKETISITYNIWELNGSGNDYGPKQSTGIVKTLPNLPVLYLKGLAQNVYLQQLTIGFDFVIPNLITFDGIDYLYTEKILDKLSGSFLDFIDDQNDRLCKWQNDEKRYAIISRNEIIEVADIVDSNTNHELPCFVKSLDMDDGKINRIIYEYLTRERSRKNPTKLPKYLSPLKTDYDVSIFATCEKDSGYTLHVCEAVERKYIETPKAIACKVLAKIIKQDDSKKLKLISETKDENRVVLISLISEIVVRFYKKADLTKNHISGSERQKYINELFYWFVELKEQEQLFNQLECSGKENRYLSALDYSTGVTYNEWLFDAIVEEIQNEKNRFSVKVISITLGMKKKETARSYESFCAIS